MQVKRIELGQVMPTESKPSAKRRSHSIAPVWFSAALLLLFVFGQIYLMAWRASSAEGRDATFTDFLSQGMLVIVAAATLLAIIALVFRTLDLARERALFRQLPHAYLLPVVRTEQLKSTLKPLLNHLSEEGSPPSVPGYFTLAADRFGFSLWSGLTQPVPIFTATWGEVKSIGAGLAQDRIRKFGAVSIVLERGEDESVELPFTFIGAGPVGVLPQRRSGLEKIENELSRLRHEATVPD